MESFVPEFVNRTPQVEIFDQILAGREPRSLFLVGGEPFIGKTFLLDQFEYMAHHKRISRIDFRDRAIYNYLTLIQSAIQDLGRTAFPTTLGEIERITLGVHHDIEQRNESIYQETPVRQANLRDLLVHHFNTDELNDLCFDLDEDYEKIPGDGKSKRARELILYFQRRSRLDELIALAKKRRPKAPWDRVLPGKGDGAGGNGGRLPAIYRSRYFPPPTADDIQRQALESTVSALFFDELRTQSEQQMVVLFYDSFEEAPDEASEWLRNYLLPELAGNRLPQVLVIIAGRRIPETAHRLAMKTVVTRLNEFDLDTVAEYWVRCRHLPDADVERVFAETEGHPLKLAERATEAGGTPLSYQALVI